MAKLAIFGLLPLLALALAIFCALMFSQNQRSVFVAALSLAGAGLCVLVALLLQLATGGTQGISWWFVLSVALFVLGLIVFMARDFLPIAMRAIYVLTFLSAVCLGVGLAHVVVADLKAHRDANFPR